MKIRREVLLVVAAVTLLAAAIYSQTIPANIFPVIPAKVYSGEELGFQVGSSSGTQIDGFFVIKVKWGVGTTQWRSHGEEIDDSLTETEDELT